MLSWIPSSVHFCVLQHQAVLRPHHLFLQIYSAALEMDKNQSEVVGKDFQWSLKVVFTYMLEDSDDGEQKCENVNGEYHSGVFLLLINVIKWWGKCTHFDYINPVPASGQFPSVIWNQKYSLLWRLCWLLWSTLKKLIIEIFVERKENCFTLFANESPLLGFSQMLLFVLLCCQCSS